MLCVVLRKTLMAALIYFHTQTLHTPPKISGDCEGGARTERFTTGRNVVTVEEKTLRKE